MLFIYLFVCLLKLAISNRVKCKGAFTPDANEANKFRYSCVVGRLNILSLLASFAREIHYTTVLHCCFGFSASARNHVTARASSWLVSAAWISANVQIFQLVLFVRIARQTPQTLNSRRVIHAIRVAVHYTVWIVPYLLHSALRVIHRTGNTVNK